jgi:GNAT superfamily N-acetyltransferase
MFVATHRGEVLGMVGAELVTARRPHAAVHRYAYLHSLFVVPAAQRLGLGRQLSRLALDWGRGRGAMQARVEMAAPNAAARRLYASLGFRLREMMLAMPLQSVR